MLTFFLISQPTILLMAKTNLLCYPVRFVANFIMIKSPWINMWPTTMNPLQLGVLSTTKLSSLTYQTCNMLLFVAYQFQLISYCPLHLYQGEKIPNSQVFFYHQGLRRIPDLDLNLSMIDKF